MASRKPDPRSWNRSTADAGDDGHACSRVPPELCDGARIVTLDDGTTQRQPGRTYQAFCDPCRSRIIACLDEIPAAYVKLGQALGDRPRTGQVHRTPFGPSEPLRGEIDALMRVTAVIVHGWEARVRRSRLQLVTREAADITDAVSVAEACVTLRKHPDVLLALDFGWMTRMYEFPPGRPSPQPVAPPVFRPHAWAPPGGYHGEQSVCRRCGAPVSRSRVSGWWWPTGEPSPGKVLCSPVQDHQAGDVAGPPSPVPEEILARIGAEETVRAGDGWVTVMGWLDGAAAGNEILDLHWRARRHLGETKPPPESFDGIPCPGCDGFTLIRAEPPSDPDQPADEAQCADLACRHRMSRDDLLQWCDQWAAWSRGAGVRVCRRCSLPQPKHGECCWDRCACSEGEHPRRPVRAA